MRKLLSKTKGSFGRSIEMNRIILMGRLSADPELKRTPSDLPVTSFTVAINRPKGKDGTQNTDWIDCVAWRNTAEFICNYFEKGKLILLEGSLQTRSYEDKNGNKRKAVEVLVDHVEFTGEWNKLKAEPYEIPPMSRDDIRDDDDLPF